MKEYNPTLVGVKSVADAENIIRSIGSDPNSISIMAPKAVSMVIRFENVVLQDAIIIKQDMLSIGGEVAVPKDTFKLHKEKGDILVIGNLKQLRELVVKLNRHYPRLKRFADELSAVLKDVK